jgi:hypothetical protein
MQQYIGNRMAARSGGMGALGNLMNQGFQGAGQLGNWSMDTGRGLVDLLKEQMNMRQRAAEADMMSKQSKGSFWGDLISGGMSMLSGGMNPMGLFGSLGNIFGGGGGSMPTIPASQVGQVRQGYPDWYRGAR